MHSINLSILIQLYYSLIYPYLTYGILIWGNTYKSTLNPLLILQKRAIRTITFSKFDAHSSPIFQQLQILKIYDLAFIETALFMHQFYTKQLPSSFDNFFTLLSARHPYNTRIASRNNYYLPKARTNYGIFNIRFTGAKVWNLITRAEGSES